MLISARICMPILFFLEEPPCSQESVNVCLRRLLLLPPLLLRLRLWLHQRESTLCGLEEVFWLLCPHSKVCGSRRRNTTNLVHLLSTASASKLFSDLELNTYNFNLPISPIDLSKNNV